MKASKADLKASWTATDGVAYALIRPQVAAGGAPRVRHCHTLTQPTPLLLAAALASMASPPRSYGATTDTRPVNTAEYERLLGDAVSGIERTEALGHTTLGKIRRQHETIGYAARRSDDTRRITQDAKKSLRALYCRLLREKLCLSTTIAILFTVDVFLFYLLLRHGGRFRSDDDS